MKEKKVSLTRRSECLMPLLLLLFIARQMNRYRITRAVRSTDPIHGSPFCLHVFGSPCRQFFPRTERILYFSRTRSMEQGTQRETQDNLHSPTSSPFPSQQLSQAPSQALDSQPPFSFKPSSSRIKGSCRDTPRYCSHYRPFFARLTLKLTIPINR